MRELLPAAIAARTKGDLSSPRIGNVTTEGDATHRASAARGTFSVNGAGVKIGVISNGVGGMPESQASGDLPATVTVLTGQAGSGSEGTAMLEIVYDLAPGAQLFFATANPSPAQFAQNIRDLRTAGCDIIVDDIRYDIETPIQDGQASSIVSTTNGGVIAQAVNDVTAAGALYFASQGNSGNLNDGQGGVFEGDFVDGGTNALLPGGTVHQFPGGNTFDAITVTSTGNGTLYWSDPLGGSSNDYDLFILNATGTSVLASSTNIQSGTQDPFETIAAAAMLAGRRMVVLKKTGAAARFFHMSTNRGRLTVATDGQTRGHSATAGAFACAATPAATPFGAPPNPTGPFPNPFNSTNTVELFSSDGPRRVFYQGNGTPFTPGNVSSTGGLLRQKPDATAADGTSVTGNGAFPTPFYGTSAAAPHAAALTALLKSANPALTPAQLRAALLNTAIDIEAPGVDRDSGVGIVDIYAALLSIGAVGTANLEVGTVTAAEAPGDADGSIEAGEGATLTVQVKNTGAVAATGLSATLTTSTPGVTISQPATSAYPDLPAQTGAGTNATPFRFTLAPTAPCPLAISFTLTVTYTGGPSPKPLTFTVPTGQAPISIASTLDTTAPAASPIYTAATGDQTARLFRDGVASTCATNKAFPGTSGTGTRRFDAYSFASCGGISRCVTISLTNACTGTNPSMFVTAYLTSFTPTALGTNYRGDPGTSQTAGGPSTFAVDVPAGATLVVVVCEVNQGLALGCNYTLNLSGLCVNCAAPNNPPVAQCQNVTVSAGASCNASASIDNGSSDPDAGDTLTLTQTPAGPYPVGTTTVTLTATDSKGAQSQCTGTVTVVDATNPTITCPANVTVPAATGQCSATVTYPAPTVTDNCTGATVSCTPASGTVFQKGTTTVTCTATDAAANTATCSFTVTVNDMQPPAVVCPANVTATANTTQGNQTGALVSYTSPTATDNCPGATVVCAPASGSFFPTGTTTVTCTATDASANTATCSFTVTVGTAFGACFVDDATGDTISLVTDPASPVYGLWQLKVAATGAIIQGNAESVVLLPGRSLTAYDHNSPTVRMDLSVSYSARTATATVLNMATGARYVLRDRNIANNPPCQ